MQYGSCSTSSCCSLRWTSEEASLAAGAFVAHLDMSLGLHRSLGCLVSALRVVTSAQTLSAGYWTHGHLGWGRHRSQGA